VYTPQDSLFKSYLYLPFVFGTAFRSSHAALKSPSTLQQEGLGKCAKILNLLDIELGIFETTRD
jgi:hypothetical protein